MNHPLSHSVWLNNIKLSDFDTPVDVILNLTITGYINTPGTYKYTAQSYEECFGEREITFEIHFAEAEDAEDVYTLSEAQLEELEESYKDEVVAVLWDKIEGSL